MEAGEQKWSFALFISPAFSLFCGLLAVAGDPSTPLAPAMFIFGDSLIDSGNNNFIASIARANYKPYGIDFGYPTGRFCNGLTVGDYGAQALGLPLIPPYLSPSTNGPKILKGLNYASAAAGILEETGTNYGVRMSFNKQLTMFEKTVKLDLPQLLLTQPDLSEYLAKSIFLISFGSNDYINNYLLPDLYSSSHMYTAEAFADLLISTLTQQLTRLYKMGARKMVLVGIGLLGCMPSQLSKVQGNGGCVEEVNQLVSLFNQRLLQITVTLNETLLGSFFVYQDTFGVFSDIIQNPSNYGFTMPNTACCGNGRYGGDLTCLPLQVPCQDRDKYVFWDAFHPTQAVNAVITKGCYSESGTSCSPISILQLAQL